LPGEFYATVMRDAMCVDDAPTTGIYFGTRSGSVFASADEGGSWSEIATHLPDVLCVRAAVLTPANASAGLAPDRSTVE